MYRCEATSLEGFVQQLVCYIVSGYRWYVTGTIPEAKEPASIDERIIAKYGIDLSKYQRARRKRRGVANLMYLRLDRFFVLIATPPQSGHPFFSAESSGLRDIRKQPIRIGGYAISSRRDGSELRKGTERWRVHVRLDRDALLMVRDYYLDIALHRQREELERELASFGFEPYAPIRRQLLALVRDINLKRTQANFEPVRRSCLRFRRRPVRPFEWVVEGKDESP